MLSPGPWLSIANMETAHYPADLAAALVAHFGADQLPSLPALTALLEITYFASMQTDEARPILCTLAFVDPTTPDPHRPRRVRPQRWTTTPFDQPVPLTVSSLTKLAHAAPPDAAALAVHIGPQGVATAWGLVDQALHDYNARAYLAAGGFARAGLFQIEVTGIGEIAIYDDKRLLGVLRRHQLLGESLDVLAAGPVHRALLPFVKQHQEELLAEGLEPGLYGSLVHDTFISTLSRVLNAMRRFRHGGALLFLPDPAPTPALAALDRKHGLDYRRLHQSVTHSARAQYLHWCAEVAVNDLWHAHDESQGELTISFPDFNEGEVRNADREDWLRSHEGCISLVAALSRIDGLVLFQGGLRVAAFGVEILTRAEPGVVLIAGDEECSPARARPSSLEPYGTRHRSMLRFCAAHPEAVGFVVSQDGDVRAITRVGEQVALFESVRLYSASVHAHVSGGDAAKGQRPSLP